MQQSPCACLSDFSGLPDVPPLLERLLRRPPARAPPERRQASPAPPLELKRNLWVCVPPKLSQLHYDCDDSLLMQLAGSKTFLLVDPAPLCGLTTYPCTQTLAPLRRESTGRFSLHLGATDASDSATASNFPLASITEPDLKKHPLFCHARVRAVTVPEDAALLLPAYWYHQVSSSCAPSAPNGGLNIAVNYWFSGGGTAAVRHAILRDHLRVRCAPPAV